MNRNILVVDDNESILRDYRKVLSASPAAPRALIEAERALFGTSEDADISEATFDVTCAAQGETAATLLSDALQKDRPFAVAFVDIRMPPGIDGINTAQKLWEIDPDLQIVICSAYSDYSWRDIQSRLGRTDQLLLLKKPFDNSEVWQLANALSAKWALTRQTHIMHKQLAALVDTRTRSLQDANQELASEIAQRHTAEGRLRHDALHDGLTQLPNRKHLLQHLEASIARTREDDTHRYAVLFLDVDNFKNVNDVFGHSVGDEFLIEVASRLSSAREHVLADMAGTTMTVARLGGDEFVVLLDPIGSTQDAVRVAEYIESRLSAPISAGGQQMTMSASIGIAVSDEVHRSADAMLANADTAMYRAKFAGKARHAVFDENMHTDVRAKLALENALRDALENQEFHLVYQPLIKMESGALLGFEALVRWNHPTRGEILPAEFIEVAENVGLIVPLGEWILQEACTQVTRWNAQYRQEEQPLCMNVNISRRQAVEPGFVKDVETVLERTGVMRSCINLELTENAVMQDRMMLNDTLHSLRRLGVHLHMDDFGTGLSSLSCLHEFPFDVVKIDRAFVQSGSKNKKYMAIVQAIITLAHNLGIQVTAEGIESPQEAALMIMMDCDFGQGYLFSRPLLVDDATALIASNKSFGHIAHDLRESA